MDIDAKGVVGRFIDGIDASKQIMAYTTRNACEIHGCALKTTNACVDTHHDLIVACCSLPTSYGRDVSTSIAREGIGNADGSGNCQQEYKHEGIHRTE